MPQMSPIYWLFLSFYFIMILFVVSSWLYFNMYSYPSKKKLFLKNYLMDWSW
uniref:ATP synthase complex subunit 8 n=1 Tax=Derotettix mendosensis TaxID=2219932 RepID=A0A3S7MGN2_9HEMI|nr:ATP synthase F0 subunit 8 [Derotettix mendosensis]